MAGNLSQIFARIILCVIYLPAGAHAIFTTERFTGEEIERIKAMDAAMTSVRTGSEDVRTVSTRPEDAPESHDERRSLCRTALRLEDAGVPRPMAVAWALAIVELAGGGILLLGLFTRLVSAPLVLIGAFQLWKGVWPLLENPLPWRWTLDESHLVAVWVAATLLPILLVLGGAGAPSVDAMTAGGGGKRRAKKPDPAD